MINVETIWIFGFVIYQDGGDTDVILGDLLKKIVKFSDFELMEDLFDLSKNIVLFFECLFDLIDGKFMS